MPRICPACLKFSRVQFYAGLILGFVLGFGVCGVWVEWLVNLK